MNFGRMLDNTCFAVGLRGTTKNEIIAEMVDLLVASGKVKDRDGALKAVMEREHKMSTGMQAGIAMPHGKADCIESLAIAFAIRTEGVDFAALDGQPSRIFVMTLTPAKQATVHIQVLAEMGRALGNPWVREKLLEATTPEQLRQILQSPSLDAVPI